MSGQDCLIVALVDHDLDDGGCQKTKGGEPRRGRERVRHWGGSSSTIERRRREGNPLEEFEGDFFRRSRGFRVGCIWQAVFLRLGWLAAIHWLRRNFAFDIAVVGLCWDLYLRRIIHGGWGATSCCCKSNHLLPKRKNGTEVKKGKKVKMKLGPKPTPTSKRATDHHHHQTFFPSYIVGMFIFLSLPLSPTP